MSNANGITETVERLRAQNTQVLVSKLFDELLSCIFTTLIPSWSAIGYYHGPTHWLARAVSQVCFRWRRVSLSISILWRSIELNHGTPEWRNELFSRSGNAPFIEITSASADRFDKIINIPGILPRICFFEGQISAEGWVQLLNNAQKLEYLAAHSYDELATFPFPDHTPLLLLRRLWMERTDHFDFSLPFFSNLNTIRISQNSFSIQYLASVVQNIPFLEQLEIEQFEVDDDSPSHRICFPRLRYLRYTGRNILKHIDPPQECMLDGFCMSLNNEAIATFSPRLIYTHIHGGNPWLGIQRNKSIFNIFNSKKCGWGLDFAYESCWGHNNCDKLVLSDNYITSHKLQVLLQELISSLAPILSTITGLTIENHEEMGWADFGPLFCHFAAVQRVSIMQTDNSLFFSFLETLYDDGSGPRMLFPSLHTLYLPDNCQWKGAEAVEFKSFLTWRIQQGAPITHVEGAYSRSVEDDFEREWNCLGQELESIYGVRVNMVYKDKVVYKPYHATISSFLVDT